MDICPACGVRIPDYSVFCNMCGCRLETAREEMETRRRLGQIPMYETYLKSKHGRKVIQVWCKDITGFSEPVDLLTCSAYYGSYQPLPNTVIRALQERKNIHLDALAKAPEMDFRDTLHCWLSQEISGSDIGRIGCVEFPGTQTTVEDMLNVVRAYFHMLDIAADMHIPLKTVVMPLIGTGRQKINRELILVPLVNEVLNMLQRNDTIEKFVFVERTYEKAAKIRAALQESYQLLAEATVEGGSHPGEPFVFLSFTTEGDQAFAELVKDAIRARGITCWYAPDSISSGDYAAEIVSAIRRSTHFVCLISENSLRSHHVLNELDLAFQRLKDGLVILPVRLDDAPMEGAFQYYLTTIQWNYGYPPPPEDRIREFLDAQF